MQHYYSKAEELKKIIKEDRLEDLSEVQEELEKISSIITGWENLPANSGGKVKVQVIKTCKCYGLKPVTTKQIAFVDYEIYIQSQEPGVSDMPEELLKLFELEQASVTMELIQD